MVSDDKSSSKTPYRNPSIDFKTFKNALKSNSIVIMTTAIGFGFNRAVEATCSDFAFPDFYNNQIIEMKNSIEFLATAKNKCINDEVNAIGKHCLKQIKNGTKLALDRMENLTLKMRLGFQY